MRSKSFKHCHQLQNKSSSNNVNSRKTVRKKILHTCVDVMKVCFPTLYYKADHLKQVGVGMIANVLLYCHSISIPQTPFGAPWLRWS